MVFAANFKVSITHDGTTTNYINDVFTSIETKSRENNYDVATLHCNNNAGVMYGTAVERFDEIKIYLDDGGSYKQVFGGNVRQCNPYMSDQGYMLELKCKGYGVALEDTHCSCTFGVESSFPTLNRFKHICEAIVDYYINESLGSGVATGYAITKTKIADFASGTDLTYINSPYQTNLDLLNIICNIATAISSPGPHWKVDFSKNLIINTVGAHENTAEWPDWWNTNEANSTLDPNSFLSFQTSDKSDEFANKTVLITGFRRPAYDYWCENNAALWGSSGLTTFDAVTSPKIVGTHALRMVQNGTNPGYIYYPSAQNAAWDVTKWGSSKTIPTLGFYLYKTVLETVCEVRMFTTNYTTTFFHTYGSVTNLNDPINEWKYIQLPIGPYWNSDAERRLPWWQSGSPDWTNINGICLTLANASTGPSTQYIDDLHFTGQIHRVAKNSTNITANHEIQKVFIAKTAMDDTGKATTDQGTAARIVLSELLRRQRASYSHIFSIPLQPKMMAGQKVKINGVILRMLEVKHYVASNGAVTTVDATDDLLNSIPVSNSDQYSTIMENILVNSKDSKDIRASGDTDVLITPLVKDYPS